MKFKKLVLILSVINCGNALNVLQTLTRFMTTGQYRLDQEKPSQENLRKNYDFIVVGAGSAGCAVAARLSENPNWNILLIEAGDNENFIMDIPMMAHFLQGYDINWKFKTEPSKTSCLAMENNQCNWPRGKVMGGSSVLNYMVYTRGHPQDYDNWAAMGNDGWDFQNVSHYFRKLENNVVPNITPNYHGKNGPITVSDVEFKSESARAFVAAGIESGYPYTDYNGPNQVGFSFLQATINNGIRASTNVGYLYPIRNRKNLHVRKNSRVTKVLIDENKNAYGVEFYSNKKYHTINATKEVILTAGALQSPQLLMLSGIGPIKHLQAVGIEPIVNLAVGYNLMDHLAPGGLTFIVNSSSITLNAYELFDLNIIDEYINNLNGPLASSGGVESIAFIETDKSYYDPNGYPDLEYLQVGGSINSEPALKRNFGIRDEIYEEVFAPLQKNGLNTFMVFPMVMRPKSRGRIKLRSDNPHDSPAILPNYFSNHYDIEIAVRGIRRLIALEKTDALQKLNARFLTTPVPGCKHLEYDSDEYWDCYTRHFTLTIYHHCGTAKMGPPSDKKAVVDPHLKVYGVKGLRVADASIMPEIVTGHTNGPTIMIAEKAADLIKSDWSFTDNSVR